MEFTHIARALQFFLGYLKGFAGSINGRANKSAFGICVMIHARDINQ
jgi:hypothetical protein